MFDIAIERRGDAPRGEIVIGAHRERFTVDLSAWDLGAYKATWMRAAAHVLERGYGRFLVSACAPGVRSYIGWTCRRRSNEAMLFKSMLLPSLAESFSQPEDAELSADDYAERNNEEPNLKTYRCALADIANFEARLRGAVRN
ncbi:MAG: hypothetical protein AB7O98_07755 [Hyphomonadaceae bacterium]